MSSFSSTSRPSDSADGLARSSHTWLGPVLFVLIVTATAVMVGLGIWQLARLRDRRATNAEIRARMAQAPLILTGQTGDLPEYQPVQISGTYDFAQEIVLRNRAFDQEPGVHLLTPLRIAGSGQAVLVDRGWIPYTQAAPRADRSTLPVSGYDIDLSDGPHLSYAIQWFSFAIILLAGSFVLWRHRRHRARSSAAPIA